MKEAMMLNIFQELGKIISGFFAIIPQIIYFLFASLISLMDVCQFLIRKLVGLDVYYTENPMYVDPATTETGGDLLRDFFEGILGINKSYPALTTVFWSLVVFGVIVLVLSTIFAIIKAQYNYDAKKSNPMTIVKNSLKSLFLMAATPLIIVAGVWISEVGLKALDDITAPSTTQELTSVFESGAITGIRKGRVNNDECYSSFDFFGIKAWTNKPTLSGTVFNLYVENCNRVRKGDYTSTMTPANENWENFSIFYAAIEDDDLRQEAVAKQIDFAFENSLTLVTSKTASLKTESKEIIAYTLTYGPSAVFAAGLINVTHFSKFNVGLVWHYYNLWAGNPLLGFAGAIAFVGLLSNLVFGLMKRLFMCVILFLISSPVIGITPLDSGNGFNEWKKSFIGYFVSGFGAVIGLNIFLLVMPIIQNLTFFTQSFLNKIFNMLILVAALSLVKRLIKLLSGFIGGTDLDEEGAGVKQGTGVIAAKALSKTVSTARVGMMGMQASALGLSKLDGFIRTKQGKPTRNEERLKKRLERQQARQKKRMDRLSKKKGGDPTKINDALAKKAKRLKVAKNVGEIAKIFAMNYAGLTNERVDEVLAGNAYVDPGTGEVVYTQDEIDPNTGAVTRTADEVARQKRKEARSSNIRSRMLNIGQMAFESIGTGSGAQGILSHLQQEGVTNELKLAAQSFLDASQFTEKRTQVYIDRNGVRQTVERIEPIVKRYRMGKSIYMSTSAQSTASRLNRFYTEEQYMKEANYNSKRACDEVASLLNRLRRGF